MSAPRIRVDWVRGKSMHGLRRRSYHRLSIKGSMPVYVLEPLPEDRPYYVLSYMPYPTVSNIGKYKRWTNAIAAAKRHLNMKWTLRALQEEA